MVKPLAVKNSSTLLIVRHQWYHYHHMHSHYEPHTFYHWLSLSSWPSKSPSTTHPSFSSAVDNTTLPPFFHESKAHEITKAVFADNISSGIILVVILAIILLIIIVIKIRAKDSAVLKVTLLVPSIYNNLNQVLFSSISSTVFRSG